jgi:hypothetical protein
MSELYGGLTIPSYADSADGPKAFKDFIDSGPIPRFANAAARDAAITSPTDGVLVYMLDTSVLMKYDGFTWLTPFLPEGGGALTGQLNMSTNRIINVGNATADGDALNRTTADGRYSLTGHSHTGLEPGPHTHFEADITDLSIAWTDVTGKPTEFTPSAHPHSGADITTGTIAAGRLPDASTSAQGVVQLSTSVASTSTTLAATPSAVKTAYDVANSALQAHTGTGSEIIVSTGAPTGGQNGDIWLRY